MHHPFALSWTWGPEQCQIFCKALSLESSGMKMPPEEDLSPLFENLKLSPGGGHLSDGSTSICVGQSGGSPGGELQTLSAIEGTSPGLSATEGTSPENETDSYYPSPPLPISESETNSYCPAPPIPTW